jgi:hypothetical protein
VLVRLAQLRFSSTSRLDLRFQTLLNQHLLPLLEPSPPSVAIAAFVAMPAFAQYLESIDPVLRLVFAAASQGLQV